MHNDVNFSVERLFENIEDIINIPSTVDNNTYSTVKYDTVAFSQTFYVSRKVKANSSMPYGVQGLCIEEVMRSC